LNVAYSAGLKSIVLVDAFCIAGGFLLRLLAGGVAAVDWGEAAWFSNNTARQALSLALTGMMNDGEITREQAVGLARMVLRENAIRLYRFGSG
jgi:4-hydroxybenzoate polyprenyltransferase